jgi:hypothetical protein
MEDQRMLECETVRQLRNRLLAETDHLVVRSYEDNVPLAAAIRDYRQALRDVPQTFDDPAEITWPELTLA